MRRAINKYGAENFHREILLECENKEELVQYETHILQELGCANSEEYYNCIPCYFGGTGKGVNSSVYGKHWKLTKQGKENHRIAALNAHLNHKGEKNPAYGKKWYNNGEVSIFCYEQDALEGYIAGHLHKTNSGKHWYTNGEVNLMLEDEDEVPEGFYLGKITYKGKANREKQLLPKEKRDRTGVNAPFYGRKHSEETKKKMSQSAKSKLKTNEHRHWYTNGKENLSLKSSQTIPNGFYLGRTITKNNKEDN